MKRACHFQPVDTRENSLSRLGKDVGMSGFAIILLIIVAIIIIVGATRWFNPR
jgi:hypothetical protein